MCFHSELTVLVNSDLINVGLLISAVANIGWYQVICMNYCNDSLCSGIVIRFQMTIESNLEMVLFDTVYKPSSKEAFIYLSTSLQLFIMTSHFLAFKKKPQKFKLINKEPSEFAVP